MSPLDSANSLMAMSWSTSMTWKRPGVTASKAPAEMVPSAEMPEDDARPSTWSNRRCSERAMLDLPLSSDSYAAAASCEYSPRVSAMTKSEM